MITNINNISIRLTTRIIKLMMKIKIKIVTVMIMTK